jgi:hypothetical protein
MISIKLTLFYKMDLFMQLEEIFMIPEEKMETILQMNIMI